MVISAAGPGLCGSKPAPAWRWNAAVVDIHSGFGSGALNPWGFCPLECDLRLGVQESRRYTAFPLPLCLLRFIRVESFKNRFLGRSYSCVLVVQVCTKMKNNTQCQVE